MMAKCSLIPPGFFAIDSHFFDLSSAGVKREGWCNGLFVCAAIATTPLPLGATDNSILLTLVDARRQQKKPPAPRRRGL